MSRRRCARGCVFSVKTSENNKMKASDVMAAALLAVQRYEKEHGRRPPVLYFGPREHEVYRLAMDDPELSLEFDGIPVLPMKGDGVAAAWA
jgi:hypothetical protein